MQKTFKMFVLFSGCVRKSVQMFLQNSIFSLMDCLAATFAIGF